MNVLRQITRNGNRRGATLVEAAIVTPLLLMLILGTLDFSVAVLRYNAISEAARMGAREVIVHGIDAPPQRPAWNSAAAEGALSTLLRPYLQAASIEDWTVTVTYEQGPDGEDITEPGSPVRVRITTTWEPIVPIWGPGLPEPPDPQGGGGSSGITLIAESRMYIAN